MSVWYLKKIFIDNRVSNSKKKLLKVDILWKSGNKFQKTNGHTQ